jgi:hypothetical protein
MLRKVISVYMKQPSSPLIKKRGLLQLHKVNLSLLLTFVCLLKNISIKKMPEYPRTNQDGLQTDTLYKSIVKTSARKMAGDTRIYN